MVRIQKRFCNSQRARTTAHLWPLRMETGIIAIAVVLWIPHSALPSLSPTSLTDSLFSLPQSLRQLLLIMVMGTCNYTNSYQSTSCYRSSSVNHWVEFKCETAHYKLRITREMTVGRWTSCVSKTLYILLDLNWHAVFEDQSVSDGKQIGDYEPPVLQKLASKTQKQISGQKGLGGRQCWPIGWLWPT